MSNADTKNKNDEQTRTQSIKTMSNADTKNKNDEQRGHKE